MLLYLGPRITCCMMFKNKIASFLKHYKPDNFAEGLQGPPSVDIAEISHIEPVQLPKVHATF